MKEKFRSNKLIWLPSYLMVAVLTVLFFLGTLNILSAQEKLLNSDSLQKEIQIDETISLIPSHYVDLVLQINEEYHNQIKESLSKAKDKNIQNVIKEYQELAHLTDYMLDRKDIVQPTESILRQWRIKYTEIEDATEVLSVATSNLTSLKRKIAEEKSDWQTYKAVLEEENGPDELITISNSALDTLNNLLTSYKTVMDSVVRSYTSLSQYLLTASHYMSSVEAMGKRMTDSIFITRFPMIHEIPIFGSLDILNNELEYFNTIGKQDVIFYTRDNKLNIISSFIIFILILAILFWTRKRSILLDDSIEPEIVRNNQILKNTLPIAIILTLVLDTFLLPGKPVLISYITKWIGFLCFIPILLKTDFRPIGKEILLLIPLFLLQEIVFIMGASVSTARWIIILSDLLLLFLLYILQSRYKSLSKHQKKTNSLPVFYIKLSPLFFIVTVAGIVLNVFGFFYLDFIINRGIILTFTIGIIYLAAFKAILSVFYHSMNSKVAQLSNILNSDSKAIFEAIQKLLSIFFFSLFIFTSLRILFLWPTVKRAGEAFWNLGRSFGPINLSVGGIIDIFLVIASFYFIGVAVKEILHKEVFPRIKLPRGVGNALSSITLYSIIFIGVIVALSDAGLQLQHLGFLAGAMGVGIGFGLQNIVNNFISGIILVFERPITVGDVIEIDNTLGTVSAIGIRSSRIRKFNGDEEIIPNSDFISKKVTNRTLSDTSRRYTMRFQTARGIDPDKVIEIANEAASKVDGILFYPPVKTYFEGIKGQAIEFYVNYWGSGNFLDLMSDVEKAVFVALENEGIPMPVPVQVEIQRMESDKDEEDE